MTRLVDIHKADEPRDLIHQCVHLLADGRLVGLPTETVYTAVAQAIQPRAVQTLRERVGSNGTNSAWPCPLAVKGLQEALDYVPGMSPLGQKLARRCWPGPVILAMETPPDEGLLAALPEETRSVVMREGELVLRAPAHPVFQDVQRLVPSPLVISPEVMSGAPLASEGRTLDAASGQQLALILDDGRCRYGQPATVVRVSGNRWSVVQPGVVSETMLRRLAGHVYLFVCTGNTCRSPVAEGLFRKFLSDKLQCCEEELPDRGFIVVSAGLASAAGAPASPEAVDILGEKGIDLRNHASQPLTDRLIQQADCIYTMTRGHRESLVSVWPEAAGRVELLSREQQDISDPMGGGLEDYRQCTQEIERHIRTVVENLDVEQDRM